MKSYSNGYWGNFGITVANPGSDDAHDGDWDTYSVFVTWNNGTSGWFNSVSSSSTRMPYSKVYENAIYWHYDVVPVNVTLSGLSEGLHSLTVYANNTGGTMEQDSVSWTVDTVNPEVTILTPINNTVYSSSSVDLNWTTNETIDVCNYELDSNGTDVALSGNTTISSLSEGTHNVSVSCNDTAGNLGQSDYAYWITDVFTPIITISSPVNNTNYITSNIDLNYSTSEATDWCAYELDQNGTNVTISGNTTLTALLNGNHNVTVYCNDTGGTVGQSDMVYWSVDLIAPVITILSPSNDTNYNSSNIDLNYSTSEATDWCAYELDQNGTNVTISGNTTLTSLYGSSHNITIYCNDTAGNIGQSDMVYWSVYLTGPVITIDSPVNGTDYISTNNIDLNWTVSSNVSWCAYSLDSATNNTGILSRYEYQENASSYWENNTLENPSYWRDGNYGTSTSSPIDNLWRYMYANYTNINFDNLIGAIWQSRNLQNCASIYQNVTLPDSCLSEDTLQIRMGLKSYQPFTKTNSWSAHCWNSSDWYELINDADVTGCANAWYDEGVFWEFEDKINYTTNVTFYNMSDGSHNLTLYCSNILGGMGQSDTIYWTTDIAAPTIEISSPVNNSIINISNSTRSIYAVYNVSGYYTNCSISLDGGEPIYDACTTGDRYTEDGDSYAQTAGYNYPNAWLDGSWGNQFNQRTYGGSGHLWVNYTVPGFVANATWLVSSYDGGFARSSGQMNLPPGCISGTVAQMRIEMDCVEPSNFNYQCWDWDELFWQPFGSQGVYGNCQNSAGIYEEALTFNWANETPYNQTYDDISTGTHNLSFSISSPYGSDNEIIFFTLESVPLVINIASPSNNTPYSTNTIDLNYSTNEPTDWCAYELDGNGTNVTISGNTTLTSLSDGNHNVTIYCNDTLGTLGQSNYIYWTVDTISPIITILSPLNNTNHVSSTINLNWSVNEAIDWCAYELDGNGTNVTISGNTTLTSLSDGNHNVTIYCNDTLGNIGLSNLNYFSIDTAIIITIIQPENNQNYSYLDLQWTTDRSTSWCGYSIDDGANTTITTNITRTDLSVDTHNLTLYCNNTGGLVSSTNVTFNILAAAPSFNHSISNQIIKYTDNLSYDINCTDPNNDTLTYLVSSAHENVTINNESGLLFHSPTYGDIGNYQINVSCTDGLATTTANFIYTVLDQIEFLDDPTDDSTESSPTDIGGNVTFIASVVTENGSNYVMYICKADDFNNVTCGAGGEWCHSGSTVSGDNASCSVNTIGLTESSYTWYAFAKMNPWVEFGVPGDFHVNHAPTSATIAISPELLYITDTAECNVTSLVDSDSDGEGTHDYDWFKNNISQSLNSATANFSFSSGDSLICSVKLRDEHGLQSDSYINSSVRVVLNSGVTAPSNLTNLSNHLTDHTPIINWTKGTDPDNDTVTTYIYMDAGTCASVDPTTLISSTNNSGYVLGVEVTTLVDGTTYCVRMRSHDGSSYSGYSDEEEFRMNSIPYITSIDINPAPAYKNSELTCVTVGTDGESDSISYDYWWTLNDAEVGGENSQTFDCDTNGCSSGDNITCTAQPYDSYEYGNNDTSDITNLTSTDPFWDENIPDFTIHHNNTLEYELDITADDNLTYWTNNSMITINTSGYMFDNPNGTDEGVYDINITAGEAGYNISQIFTYTIINDYPIITSWEFRPSPNDGANDANFSYVDFDNESDIITINTKWYVNTSHILGTDDTTSLSQTNFGDGSLVTISVLLSDPFEFGSWENYSITMGDDGEPTIASVFIGDLSGTQITTADLYDTVSFFANATDDGGDISWVKFQVKSPTANSTNYTVYNIYDSNQYRFNKQVSDIGTWYLEKVFAQDTSGNIAQYTANLELEVSEGLESSGGGGGDKFRETLLVYNATEEQLLDVTCGNRVCDKNEHPGNCPEDCPVNFDVVFSGELFGQYWFIQILILFITGVIVWTLIKGSGKKRKKR